MTDVQQLTPAWLTARLRRNGVLAQGVVDHIALRANEAFNSVVVHLEVTYSPDASALAPHALLLKLSSAHNGALEHDFYHLQLTHAPGSPPIVPCYDTAYSPLTGDSHCLLQDVSATHRAPVTRQHLLALHGVPSAQHLAQLVDSLAQFHAYWWQHPQLGSGETIFAIRPWYRDYTYYQRHIARRQTEWAQFSAQAGDHLSAEQYTLYTEVLRALPGLWDRYLAPRLMAGKQLTLTHGDCYLTQFLCPVEDESLRTYLVDFDSISANFAAYDLAYLIPTFWTRAQRYEEDREQTVLGRYYQALCAYGVADYAWETLLTDYRLMITLMIFDPIWDHTSGASPAYWRPKLQCLTDAYLDLDCAALLTA